jgi:hypothetical protein
MDEDHNSQSGTSVAAWRAVGGSPAIIKALTRKARAIAAPRQCNRDECLLLSDARNGRDEVSPDMLNQLPLESEGNPY